MKVAHDITIKSPDFSGFGTFPFFSVTRGRQDETKLKDVIDDTFPTILDIITDGNNKDRGGQSVHIYMLQCYKCFFLIKHSSECGHV